MAVEKIVNINIKDNANDVEKDIRSLNKAGQELEQTYKDVNSTFEDVYGELKPLTARLGEAEDRLYELALAGKQNTQEYRELLKATANYRQVQIDTDLVVDMAAQRLNLKMISALEGVAGAFAVVQGSMGLFVTESEELDKALLKVQSAMALVQGIEGVRTALPLFKSFAMTIKNVVVGAFTSLRGAIISTGIGALVVALGMAADAMGLFGDATEDAADANQKLADSIAKNTTEIDRRINRTLKQQQLIREEAEAFGATERELFEMRKKEIDLEEELRMKQYNLNLARIDKLKKKKSEDVQQEVENLRNQNTALYDSLFNRIQGENDYDIKRRELEIEYTKFTNNQLDQQEKKADEKGQRDIEKAKERSRQLQEIERQRLINLQNLENEFLSEIEMVESEYFDSKLSEQEREVRAVEDKYFNLLNKAQEYNDSLTEKEQEKRINTVTLEEARLSEIATIEQSYRDKRLKAEKETNEKLKEDAKQLQDQKIDAVSNGFSTISNLAKAFEGQSEEQQKRAFEIQKAANTANALIDTYKSATGAYASLSAVPVVGPVLGAVAAGAAIAAGLANVKAIQSQKFAVSGASSPTVPNVTNNQSTQQLSTPNFNVVGASGISQTENLQPVKAYVVSGDVTTAQALDRNRIQNATF